MLSVAATNATSIVSIVDTGDNHTNVQINKFSDPFNPESSFHILESTTNLDSETELNHDAFMHKMQLQYFDSVKDSKDEDWSFVPQGVLELGVSYEPCKAVTTVNNVTTAKVLNTHHVCVKTAWKSGEVSWTPMDALKEQNPWVVVNCAMHSGLTSHILNAGNI